MLLTPSPGEIYDRLSILELKIKHGGGRHFHIETEELLAYLAKIYQPSKFPLEAELPSFHALASVNALLWSLESQVRLTPDLQTYVQITKLNDIRASLIVYINGLFGIEAREKLHS